MNNIIIKYNVPEKEVDDLFWSIYHYTTEKCEEDFGKDTAHHYGMPSGHAQMAFFSIVFVYLTTKKKIVFLWMCLFGFITLYQRFNRKCHSISQLAGGAITGSIVSASIYWITKYGCKNGCNNIGGIKI